MNKNSLKYFKCISCGNSKLNFKNLIYYKKKKNEILDGIIVCSNCNKNVKIECGVPNFVKFSKSNSIEKKTSKHYGSSWKESDVSNRFSKTNIWHYDELVKISKFPKNEKGLGLEAGCGHGKDSIRLSISNKKSHIISIDISEGAYVTKQRLNNLNIENVTVVRSDLSKIPIRDNIVDWGYSFGVLHHMPYPEKGFKEISRILKKNSKLVLYLYSDLSEKPFLKFFLFPINILRKFTRYIPLTFLKLICFFIMPFVYLFLTMPAKFIKLIGFYNFSIKIPHHHNQTMISIYGELYDRFGAQIEFRYSIDDLKKIFEKYKFKFEGNGQIPIWRGHIIWGRKK